MEESLSVKTIGDGSGDDSKTGAGGGFDKLSHRSEPGSATGTALTRDGGTGGLISILKGLEIEKSLATDPVVVALRYYPGTSGSFAPLPPELAPKLVEYLRGRLMTWLRPGRVSW